MGLIFNLESLKDHKIEVINYSEKDYLDSLNKLNHCGDIKSFKGIEGEIKIIKIKDLYNIKFNVKVEIEAISTYTFNEFIYTEHLTDELFITNNKDMEYDEVIYEESTSLDLDQLVYSLVVVKIPINLHKEGETLPSGEGFKVYSEDELEEELAKEESESSPFDVLKDLDLD